MVGVYAFIVGFPATQGFLVIVLRPVDYLLVSNSGSNLDGHHFESFSNTKYSNALCKTSYGVIT